ncbi:MAG: peptidase dimerization domain-containing protein, partial [Bdellovibrionota bacterium]
IVEGAKLLKEGPNPGVQVWRFPSLTINAIQASSRAQAGNIICDMAWARVTVRLVPEMVPEKTLALLEKHLKAVCPWGLELKLKSDDGAGPWSIDPEGPKNKAVFEKARRALEAGYGKAPLLIGCGGSIPFVEPFARALGGVPALLVGVEDPYTNAHGENESLLVDDFRKACLSQVLLFAELGN